MKSKLIALCMAVLSCATWANVSITINSDLYKYQGKPRLSQVLQNSVGDTDWYTAANALYRVDDGELEALRNETVQDLNLLLVEYASNTQLCSAITNLIEHIKTWQLAKRIPIIVDYDLARINQKYNPKFDDGQYIIKLRTRPSQVSIFGAMAVTSSTTHRPHTDVHKYLEDLPLTAIADVSEVIIISAAGNVKHAGIAYWNTAHSEVAPGAQIFIPFQAGLIGNKLEKINYQIVELASNRLLN